MNQKTIEEDSIEKFITELRKESDGLKSSRIPSLPRGEDSTIKVFIDLKKQNKTSLETLEKTITQSELLDFFERFNEITDNFEGEAKTYQHPDAPTSLPQNVQSAIKTWKKFFKKELKFTATIDKKAPQVVKLKKKIEDIIDKLKLLKNLLVQEESSTAPPAPARAPAAPAPAAPAARAPAARAPAARAPAARAPAPYPTPVPAPSTEAKDKKGLVSNLMGKGDDDDEDVDDIDDGDGDGGNDYEIDGPLSSYDTFKDEESEQKDDEKDEKKKSFFDTLYSWIIPDEKQESSEGSEGSEGSDKSVSSKSILDTLDVTGLFKKDKSFVPSESDSRKIEIAESELNMLRDSENRLKQELKEQTERITAYKRDIQNKISHQYALLDFEKSEFKKTNRTEDFRKNEKFYRLVDTLRNRERFLDKKEEILRNKRQKDLKELDETKKKLISELFRQLDKEKNIIIRNKNRENSILMKQLKYYKGNNAYLQSIIDSLEECRDSKLNKRIKKKQRTLMKRKKDRKDKYTDSGVIEITL